MSWIRNLLHRRATSPAPRLELTSAAAFELLTRETAHRWHARVPLIRLADRGYSTLTAGEAFSCIRDAGTLWTPERNDCDDLTFAAKFHACRLGMKLPNPALFGIAWSSIGHALNFYVDPAARLRWLDVGAGAEVQLTGDLTLLVA